MEEDGTLRACKAEGHAKAGKMGQDIVCASVSLLFGTAFSTLSGRKGITVRYGALQPGKFWLEADYTTEGKDFLFASGEFLLEGLKHLAQEFPKNCKLNISTLQRTCCRVSDSAFD